MNAERWNLLMYAAKCVVATAIIYLMSRLDWLSGDYLAVGVGDFGAYAR